MAFIIAIGPRADAAQAPGVLDRKLVLNLWGAGFEDLAVAVKAQTGVDIVFFLPDLPTDQNTDNVYIVTGEVDLAAVLEALARRFSFRFRVAESGRVELSRGYGWVPAEPALRFCRTGCLISEGGCDAEGMRRFLGEFLKPLPLLRGDFLLRLETYPLPGDPGHFRATAVMPPELADYLVRGLRCLSGEAGDYPAPHAASSSLFVRAREYDGDWEALLSRSLAPPGEKDLRGILANVAGQTGGVFVLRAPPSVEGELPSDMMRYTFGRICELLASEWGLGRRVFLASGGVVFERGDRDDFETDARNRELFWGGLAVAGMDAERAAEACGGGDGLLANIRREVYPGVWRDPACTLVYSPVTGRVAVVAPYNVVEAVARKIAAFSAGGRR